MNKEECVACATQIVDAYMDRDVPLSEGVLKVAQAQGLTAQQVMLLSNFTNTIAHTQSWRKQAEVNGPDRYITFDAVDPDEVIKLAGLAPRDGNAAGPQGPTIVSSYGEKTASATPAPPLAQDAFVPGIVPDERWAARSQQLEKVAAEAPTEEVFSVEAPRTGMSAREARTELEKIAAQLDDEIQVAYAGYDAELRKIGAYLSGLYPEDVPARVQDMYAVSPERADKLAMVLNHLVSNPMRPYSVFDARPYLEQHAEHVKMAAWHLPLSPLPIRATVASALDHLDHLQELGQAHTFLTSKLS